MGLHSYAGGAFRKYAAKGFGSCANRESNRVPCVHISFFFLSLAQGIFMFVLNIPCVFHYTILSSIPSVIVERNENSKRRNVSNSIRWRRRRRTFFFFFFPFLFPDLEKTSIARIRGYLGGYSRGWNTGGGRRFPVISDWKKERLVVRGTSVWYLASSFFRSPLPGKLGFPLPSHRILLHPICGFSKSPCQIILARELLVRVSSWPDISILFPRPI